MPKMTLKEMYARHQELWFWLADNPWKWKRNWPGWKKYGYELSADCFACEYAEQHFGCRYCPSHCPFDWPGGDCDELYEEWRYARKGSDHRALMADLIANVPLKKRLKE